MNLAFGLLRITNFCAISASQTIDLDCGAGLHYMRGINALEPELGANDCGKSSIWRAMCWCLFGRTADDPSLKTPDIRPWKSEGTTRVMLVVYTDDKPRKIVRTAAPNKLMLDDETCSQEQIVELLHMDFDVFINTILLAQGRDLFLDLDPTQKMQIFSDVLHLDRWTARSKHASNVVNDLEQQHSHTKGELSSAKESAADLTVLESEARDRRDTWENERQSTLTDIETAIGEIKQTLEKRQLVLDAAILARDSAGTEAKALRKKLDELRAEYNKLEGQISREEAKKTVLLHKKAEVEADLAKLLEEKLCPTCGQDIKPKDQKALQKKWKEEINRSDLALVGLEHVLKAATKASQDMARTISSAEANLSVFAEKEEKAEAAVNVAQPRVIELNEKLAAERVRQTALKNDDNPHRDAFTTLRKRRKVAEGDVEHLETLLAWCSRQIERNKFWVKGFKDVQLFIVEEVLTELQMVTNAILPEMGLGEWTIKYDIEKELKSGNTKPGLYATILSPYNDKDVKWQSWGGGVAQRMRIASALALSETLLSHTGVQCDLEILDEPSRGLSNEGIANLIEMLAERAQRLKKTVFLVDHRLLEGARFASTITVRRTPQGSQISQVTAK